MSYVSQKAHPSSGEIIISTDRYNTMRFSIGGLVVAVIGVVLILLFSQPKVAPPPPPNDAWIEEQLDLKLPPDVVTTLKNADITTMVIIDKKSRLRVLGPDGKNLDVCADIQGTRIVERPGKSCGLKGITPLTEIQINHFAHNPHGSCTSGGGKVSC